MNQFRWLSQIVESKVSTNYMSSWPFGIPSSAYKTVLILSLEQHYVKCVQLHWLEVLLLNYFFGVVSRGCQLIWYGPWLEHAIECCWQALVDKMFEALSVTSCDIQREIISCIPEVIDDMQHVDVAHRLKWVMSPAVTLRQCSCTYVSFCYHANVVMRLSRPAQLGWVMDEFRF